MKAAIERLETDSNFGVEIDHEGSLSESNKKLLRGAVRESPVAKTLAKQLRLKLAPSDL
ncbi:hypothetical protein [Cupriavidus consociatus]|uniref:hypothetical protein n=1 Tax=Cupriavidus consociatus TaxID=2821357 RepID=UPI001AE169ED|nr:MULTISPECIES: hypothetical protein [unclassified Cupriavidus]MBP0622483.1 hypothetical protein [Cupriavidus sp. LEh25]MDK2659168.1 hypothetical protein [Cupriavidus sp. LEh21]